MLLSRNQVSSKVFSVIPVSVRPQVLGSFVGKSLYFASGSRCQMHWRWSLKARHLRSAAPCPVSPQLVHFNSEELHILSSIQCMPAHQAHVLWIDLHCLVMWLYCWHFMHRCGSVSAFLILHCLPSMGFSLRPLSLFLGSFHHKDGRELSDYRNYDHTNDCLNRGMMWGLLVVGKHGLA